MWTHFSSFFTATCSLFIKKTSTKPDGVAVFWNAKKLKVKESTHVNLDLPNGDESGEFNMAYALMPTTAMIEEVLTILSLRHIR